MKPTHEEAEAGFEELRALIEENRKAQPRLAAEIAMHRRERDKALRSRDVHRANILSLLARVPEPQRAELVARHGIDLEGWAREAKAPRPARQGKPAPIEVPVPAGHCVYFIQGVDGGPIKIGTSTDVESRLRTLQCASPVKLRVVGVVSGGVGLESQLHRRLALHRLHGEWFAAAPEVIAAIGEVLL